MFRQIREFLLILLGSMALWSHFAEADDLFVPDQYPTITSALTAAANNTSDTDIIHLRRGTYSEHVTLIDKVSLWGDETARTIIDGGGAGTVVTAANGSTIQRLTITNGDIGIAVPGSATVVTIKNNIITKHNTSGIQYTGPGAVTVSHNTLDSNGTAITCTNAANVTITNNILSNNTTNDISLDQSSPVIDFNLFSNNATEDYVDTQLRNQPPNQTHNIFTPKVGDANPDFVNPNNNDFHLQSNSPAIGTGENGTEIGVYGGGNNDPPFPVSNLRVTPSTDPNNLGTITVGWDRNLAYNVHDYKVYYDSQASLSNAQVIDAGNDITKDITNLTTSVTAPSPQDLRIGIGDTELLLNWTPISQAIVVGYRIYYGIAPNDCPPTGSPITPITVDGRNSSSYLLTNLDNGKTYCIALFTIAKPVYFVTVTALDDQSHESDFAPVKETALNVPEVESSNSIDVSEYPEPVGRFPNLPNEGGCFIATAAYGSPLEPHVQTLRTFRDRYLLTNSLGRKFVSFYYQISPPLAYWLEEHASFKPAVRAFLSPIVFVTESWMNAAPFGQMLSIVLVLSLVGLSVYRWGILRRGGHY